VDQTGRKLQLDSGKVKSMNADEPVKLACPNNDRGVLRCWQEWQIEGRHRRIVLCVETALELRPGHAGFNREHLDDLIEHAGELMHGSNTPIDAIRIIPAP
jgi:hypothetical protein